MGRFGSLVIDFNDFIKHPIIGYGIQRRDTSKHQLRTQAKYNYTKLVRVNGFSDRLATFGVVGMLFYLTSIYLGFKRYLMFYNYRGQIWLLILFLMMEFATNLLTSPFCENSISVDDWTKFTLPSWNDSIIEGFRNPKVFIELGQNSSRTL